MDDAEQERRNGKEAGRKRRIRKGEGNEEEEDGRKDEEWEKRRTLEERCRIGERAGYGSKGRWWEE